ncbi:MAG: diguanylate cyclase, partial [Pseudomonadota bacterium]
FRFYISDLLSKHCFRVIEATTSDEALQKLADHPEIRLVITDASEEGLDGLAVVETIRGQYGPRSLGIVAMSASESPEVNVDLLKAGANDFIRKPFAMEEFYCRINQNVDILDYIEEIKNSMIRDYLTGAFNRRYLYEAGEQFYQNAQRGNITIAVAMIDADNFKSINDNYGHDAGDAVLVHMAGSLKNALRSSDIVARFGGEEFVCIVSGVDTEQVSQLFDRVRASIEAMQISTDHGTLQVTASIGVTTTLGESLDDMLSYADQAMYEAKDTGRNKVVVR